jgi:hypothetical protein
MKGVEDGMAAANCSVVRHLTYKRHWQVQMVQLVLQQREDPQHGGQPTLVPPFEAIALGYIQHITPP